MRKLKLDFNIQRRRNEWVGWTLLIIGLALLAEMTFSYISLQREMGNLEKTLVKNGIAAKKPRPNNWPNAWAQGKAMSRGWNGHRNCVMCICCGMRSSRA